MLGRHLIMTPTFIRSSDDLSALVKFGETAESICLEFKRDLNGWKSPDANKRRDGRKELARDLAQFCNTWGGCLLLGVDEASNGAARVAARLAHIDDFDGRRQWIEQAIADFLVPSAIGIEVLRVDVSGCTAIAVNVPPNERLVTLWDRQAGTIECHRRTNHGKQALHPSEIEAHLTDSRRTAQLAFQRVRNELPNETAVELSSGVWSAVRRTSVTPSSIERVPGATVQLSNAGEHDFELCVRSRMTHSDAPGGQVIRIPYGLLREAWVTSDRKIGLFLHVRILHEHEMLTLDPF
jgi:hypothetical protein